MIITEPKLQIKVHLRNSTKFSLKDRKVIEFAFVHKNIF